MQYLQFRAEPKNDNPEADKFGGAFVSCWVKDRTKQQAQDVASIMIEDNGWVPLLLEKQVQVEPSGLEEGSEAKEYF